ncbi:MAG: hypothetical protein CMP67_03520 [Flavobacteriales bacterium]|nr:hypothetical protein [Flavobacteriales bacterium]|tara:strand:+ start:44 stop:1024 length:981 start_codon:yes stop_codon:yes gene_type:complete
MNRTELNILSNFSNLNVQDKSLFLGSCFAENIGKKFQSYHLNTSINPLGVVFHPIPLFGLLKRALDKNYFNEKDFFEYQDYWFNYELSGKCAKYERNESVDFANKKLRELDSELSSSSRLFLTFGSSILRKFESLPVANCHKQPLRDFEKEISSVSNMIEYLKPILKKIFQVNPSIKISLSVSPVRHTKEGMMENSLSKSNLIILCNQMASQFKNVEYLPIYEVVIDELRDYSFFNNDLVHPNEKAIEIVWEKIKKGIGSKDFNRFCNQSQKLLNSFQHKTMYPKSKQNILFLNNLLTAIIEHENNYDVNWHHEKKTIVDQLKSLA